MHHRHLQALHVQLPMLTRSDAEQVTSPRKLSIGSPVQQRSPDVQTYSTKGRAVMSYSKVAARACAAFEQTRQRADDLILHAIMNKIDEMLMLTETVDWANETGTGSVPHGFIHDMIQYLDASNQVLELLEQSKREFIIFKACEHVAAKMVDLLCADNDIHEINVNSIRIMRRDIQELERFGMSITDKCRYTFAEVKLIIEYIVGDGGVEDMFERLMKEVEDQPHVYLVDDMYKQSWAHNVQSKVREFEKWVAAHEKDTVNDGVVGMDLRDASHNLGNKMDKILRKIMNRYIVQLMRYHSHLKKKAEQIQASLAASGSGTAATSQASSGRRRVFNIFGKKKK